jgi:hypothetical protein
VSLKLRILYMCRTGTEVALAIKGLLAPTIAHDCIVDTVLGIKTNRTKMRLVLDILFAIDTRFFGLGHNIVLAFSGMMGLDEMDGIGISIV